MPFHPSDYRIMVGKIAFFIHMETVRLKIIGTHNIVNSDIHTIPVIGETWSHGCRDIAVLKLFSNGSTRIAYRYIIKVSADYHRTPFVHSHIACNSFCLRSPDSSSCTKLLEYKL